MYEIQGTIKALFDVQTFKNDFTKREFVITTQENYPQDIKLECTRDRCALLDDFQEGDFVKAHFNIRGNEYNGRYFVNLQAWKIEKSTGEESEPVQQPSEGAAQMPIDSEEDGPF